MRTILIFMLSLIAIMGLRACLPEPGPVAPTSLYFVQSQENEGPDSESAYFKETDCSGEVTEDPLQAKSVYLDAYFYSAIVDAATGLITSHVSEESRIGKAKICGSNKSGGAFIPIFPLTATFKGTFSFDQGSAPDLIFEIDGECYANSLVDPDSWAAQGALTACDVDILPNAEAGILGGKASSNSLFGALTEEATGSFWTIRLVFHGEQ